MCTLRAKSVNDSTLSTSIRFPAETNVWRAQRSRQYLVSGEEGDAAVAAHATWSGGACNTERSAQRPLRRE
jgi:hypothetical protein